MTAAWPFSGDVERHDGPEPPDCRGQWCCGCTEHPSGKPWGWNHAAWAEHFTDTHPPASALGPLAARPIDPPCLHD